MYYRILEIWGVVVICEMGCHDIEENRENIASLLKEIFVRNFTLTEQKSIELSKQKIEDLNKYIVSNNTKIYGAYLDGFFVGFVWAYIYDFLKNSRVHVNYIAVNRLHRGNGIAKLLLREAEYFAKLNSIKEIDLNVSLENKSGVSLYRSLRFKEDTMHMVKNIT